ncbi:elongation of very long chain fatty acids protein 1-like [Oppia nitens]|uniref:elongation of very long chain fatty acids protein 1-like n=1 Tax=Oppia nitens TaxID=1686743 RepID=UPI0023DA5F0B|nr:elongation of very long chain fatty acids protein 1-like [Oppia nitens]
MTSMMTNAIKSDPQLLAKIPEPQQPKDQSKIQIQSHIVYTVFIYMENGYLFCYNNDCYFNKSTAYLINYWMILMVIIGLVALVTQSLSFQIFYAILLTFSPCPFISDYPLMTTPWPLLAITGGYLYFVKWLGPQLMANRKPYDLRWPIRIFNSMMVAVNFYGLYQFIPRTNFGLNVWNCPQSCQIIDSHFIFLGYVFFLSRMAEYMDTVFFVLRKKHRQVSNLHVFHHSIVPIAIWSVFKFSPGVENAMYPFINSFIHVLMYLYYTLASFGDRFEPYLKWKRHLTSGQLVQFILIIVHSVRAPFIGCPMSSTYFVLISTALGGIFFYLFYRFYMENYTTKDKILNNNNNHNYNNNTNSDIKMVQVIEKDDPDNTKQNILDTYPKYQQIVS